MMQSFLAFPYCLSHFFIIFLKNRCRTHYPVSYAAHPYKRFSSLYTHTSVYGTHGMLIVYQPFCQEFEEIIEKSQKKIDFFG